MKLSSGAGFFMTAMLGLRMFTQEMLEFKSIKAAWQDPVSKRKKKSHRDKDCMLPDVQLLT